MAYDNDGMCLVMHAHVRTCLFNVRAVIPVTGAANSQRKKQILVCPKLFSNHHLARAAAGEWPELRSDAEVQFPSTT